MWKPSLAVSKMPSYFIDKKQMTCSLYPEFPCLDTKFIKMKFIALIFRLHSDDDFAGNISTRGIILQCSPRVVRHHKHGIVFSSFQRWMTCGLYSGKSTNSKV